MDFRIFDPQISCFFDFLRTYNFLKKGDLLLYSCFSDTSEGVEYGYGNINAQDCINFLKFSSKIQKIVDFAILGSFRKI